MTIAQANSFEGGTNGTTITAANSGGGSGDAFDNVSITTGATVTYSNTTAAHGTLSAAMVGGTTTGGPFLQWLGLTGAQGALRYYFRFTALPTVALQLAVAANAGTVIGRVILFTTGALGYQNSAGTTVWNGTATMAVNTWYRIEVGIIPGSTTAGTANVAVYLGDSTTALDSFSSSAVNTSAATTLERWNVGRVSSNWAATLYHDDLAISTDSSAFIGPANVGATVAGPVGTAAVTAPAGFVSTGGPVLAATYDTGAETTAATQSTTVTVGAGDLLVLAAGTSIASSALSTPTGGSAQGITWSLVTSATGVASTGNAYAWKGTATSAGTFTVSVTDTAGTGGWWAFQVLRFTSHNGVGASAASSNAGTAPTLGLTTTAANSGVVMLVDDWNALSGASRAYDTSASTFAETFYDLAPNGSASTLYAGLYQKIATAGAKTFGMTAPTGQKPAVLLVEVKTPGPPVTLAGPKGTVAATAPAGTVVTAGGASLAGPKGTVTATAPVGSLVLGQALAGPKGTVTATAPVGTTAMALAGPKGTVTATAPAGAAGAVVLSHNPGTATLLADGTSVVTLAGDGTSTAALTPAIGTAALTPALGTATIV